MPGPTARPQQEADEHAAERDHDRQFDARESGGRQRLCAWSCMQYDFTGIAIALAVEASAGFGCEPGQPPGAPPFF
jgi:hypothetical protein